MNIADIIDRDALATQRGEPTFTIVIDGGSTVTVKTGSLRRGDDDGHRAGDELGGGLIVLADQSGGRALMGQQAFAAGQSGIQP